MSYPKNPNTLILKNKFYPQGLKEIDIWNYYQKVKTPILQEIKNRDIMFYIMVELNKSIIRRKGKGEYIRLTPKNYDDAITGRTISLHSSMGIYENFAIIDIDVEHTDSFKWSIEVTRRVYDFIMDKVPIIRSASIRFTGKTSFHIKCDFGRKMKVDATRFLLEKFLRDSELARVYTIDGKRRPGIPNLDLKRNCFRCNYITLNSLSVWGLKCMDVPYSSLTSFDPRQARIK